MTTELMTLEIRSREEWRTWLSKHHASSPGVWLVFHKEHTGVTSIDYDDSVCEPLCFGWIDSLIKTAKAENVCAFMGEISISPNSQLTDDYCLESTTSPLRGVRQIGLEPFCSLAGGGSRASHRVEEGRRVLHDVRT